MSIYIPRIRKQDAPSSSPTHPLLIHRPKSYLQDDPRWAPQTYIIISTPTQPSRKNRKGKVNSPVKRIRIPVRLKRQPPHKPQIPQENNPAQKTTPRNQQMQHKHGRKQQTRLPRMKPTTISLAHAPFTIPPVLLTSHNHSSSPKSTAKSPPTAATQDKLNRLHNPASVPDSYQTRRPSPLSHPARQSNRPPIPRPSQDSDNHRYSARHRPTMRAEVEDVEAAAVRAGMVVVGSYYRARRSDGRQRMCGGNQRGSGSPREGRIGMAQSPLLLAWGVGLSRESGGEWRLMVHRKVLP